MKRELEVDLDKNSWLVGTVKVREASFSHAFGIEHRDDVELTNFKAFVFFNGEEIDVTTSFTKAQLEVLEETFIEKIQDELYELVG